MPLLSQHQSNKYTKLLVMGDSGCLAGDTIISITRGRSKSKYRSLSQLCRALQDVRFDHSLDTYLLSDLGGYVGLNKMLDIKFTGVKPVRTVKAGNRTIQATEDHEFFTDDGWLPLSKIKAKHRLFETRFSRDGQYKTRLPSQRAWIYSVPNHPFAITNIVNGADYKRDFRARLIVEAAMNNMSLEEFVLILRHDYTTAKALKYLSRDMDVHHINHNELDDRIENLIVLTRDDHIALHQQEKVRASKSTYMIGIESISEPEIKPTFDIVMDNPHRNFIANGVVVHNSGKTGALTPLVAAGYSLRILDFDNGLETLKQFVLKECPERIANVEFRTLRDKRKATATGTAIDGSPKAFVNALKMLDNWKYDEVDLGPPAGWGPDVILVIDSLTFMSDAAFDFREPLAVRGRDGHYDMRAVYKDAQDAIEDVLATISSEWFETNVIVISHIRYLEREDGTRKGYPTAVGAAISPIIPRYFNSVALCQTSAGGKRTIQTAATAMIDLKNPKPFEMLPSYPIGTGLADFFQVLREPPTQQIKPQIRKVK